MWKNTLLGVGFLSISMVPSECFQQCHEHVTYSMTDADNVPLDHKLVDIMNYPNGIFIEVGALDGNEISNTKLFEEFYGWTGILVEPSPNLFAALCANRPNSRCFQCALGSFDEHETYAYGDFDGHPMASLVGRAERPSNVRVLVRSLQSILDECDIRHVHFFSLDTEGYELNILNGVDFDKTTFDYLLIEVYTYQFDDIVRFLEERGYDLVSCFSNYNSVSNPGWDGTHNDYLFKRRALVLSKAE
jgi:FkbM family methyltransferase